MKAELNYVVVKFGDDPDHEYVLAEPLGDWFADLLDARVPAVPSEDVKRAVTEDLI